MSWLAAEFRHQFCLNSKAKKEKKATSPHHFCLILANSFIPAAPFKTHSLLCKEIEAMPSFNLAAAGSFLFQSFHPNLNSIKFFPTVERAWKWSCSLLFGLIAWLWWRDQSNSTSSKQTSFPAQEERKKKTKEAEIRLKLN